jgi:hypothetical protein
MMRVLVSIVMEDNHDECVDAVNGGLHICLPVEGDSPAGLCTIVTMKMARRPAWVAPTELVRRPTWEGVANRFVCHGDLRGLAADGPAQRRSFRCKETL